MEQKRYKIFEKNLIRIYKHNQKNASYQLEINQFADKEEWEFKSLNFGNENLTINGKSTIFIF